jgi:nitrate reductase / nitrite oxidoreductase, alpha subunit
MNGTSFFYAHTSQWRHEKLEIDEILAPGTDPKEYDQLSMLDLNARSERMGWLPSAPQLQTNPLDAVSAAHAAGQDPVAYASQMLKKRQIEHELRRPREPSQLPSKYVCMALEPYEFQQQSA